MIDPAFTWDENCHFRRHPDASSGNQEMLRVQQCRERTLKIQLVPTNLFGGRARPGIDNPKRDPNRGKIIVQFPEFRGIGIGDRAVHTDEQKDERLCSISSKRVDFPALGIGQGDLGR